MKDQTKLSRRRLLAHVSVVAAAMAPVATIALGGLTAGDAALANADPIFAAIAEHKAAVETCIAPDDEAKSEKLSTMKAQSSRPYSPPYRQQWPA